MKAKYNPADFGKVVVLMGGFSIEREVSLIGGKKVLKTLLDYGIHAEGLDVQDDVAERLISMKPDRAFITLQGDGGEDGTIQGLLQYLNINYTGSSLVGCAITHDRIFTKLIWQNIGMITPPFRLVHDIEGAINAMEELGLPITVKANTDVSNLAISKVSEPEELTDAFNMAAMLSGNILIEPWIEGTTYGIGIIGNQALPLVEIQPPTISLDELLGPSKLTTRILPAETESYLRDLALRAFQIVGCGGWGRIDVIEDHLSNFWFLKAKTVPSLIDSSYLLKAATACGISFEQLIIEVLAQTIQAERYSTVA